MGEGGGRRGRVGEEEGGGGWTSNPVNNVHSSN